MPTFNFGTTQIRQWASCCRQFKDHHPEKGAVSGFYRSFTSLNMQSQNLLLDGALRWAGRTRIHGHAHIADGYLKKRASDRSLNAVVERLLKHIFSTTVRLADCEQVIQGGKTIDVAAPFMQLR